MSEDSRKRLGAIILLLAAIALVGASLLPVLPWGAARAVDLVEMKHTSETATTADHAITTKDVRERGPSTLR
jgi:hypothetical protein